jgi:hypothetical protein
MKQSAVEFLVEEINKLNLSTEARAFINKLQKQAKEIEKEQQGYSEEEVISLIFKRDNYLMTPNSKSLKEFLTPKEWFNQNKNK